MGIRPNFIRILGSDRVVCGMLLKINSNNLLSLSTFSELKQRSNKAYPTRCKVYFAHSTINSDKTITKINQEHSKGARNSAPSIGFRLAISHIVCIFIPLKWAKTTWIRIETTAYALYLWSPTKQTSQKWFNTDKLLQFCDQTSGVVVVVVAIYIHVHCVQLIQTHRCPSKHNSIWFYIEQWTAVSTFQNHYVETNFNFKFLNIIWIETGALIRSELVSNQIGTNHLGRPKVINLQCSSLHDDGNSKQLLFLFSILFDSRIYCHRYGVGVVEIKALRVG